MTYLKPAAALLLLAVALSPTTASAAAILNSSTVSLQTSAWASVGEVNDSDADQLIPSDAFLTDFQGSIYSGASASITTPGDGEYYQFYNTGGNQRLSRHCRDDRGSGHHVQW